MATTRIPGWDKLRGRRGLELHREIVKLRKEDKKSVLEIAHLLKLSKKSVVKNLYANGNRLFAKRILENSTIDCFIAIADSIEIAQIQMEVTNVLMQAGELHYTPEQFGTHVRSIEHLMDLFKLLNGRSVTMFREGTAEAKDPALELARKRLEESQRKAVNGKTIEVNPKPAIEEETEDDD